MATPTQEANAKIAVRYTEASNVLQWLADNGHFDKSKVDAFARQFAAGPGTSETNYRRAWLDKAFPV